MPAGLEIYDTSGAIALDMTSFVGTFIGYFNTGGGQSGSHTDELLINRALVYHVSGPIDFYGGPTISFNGATGVISWAFVMNVTNMSAPSPPDLRVYYGGY